VQSAPDGALDTLTVPGLGLIRRSNIRTDRRAPQEPPFQERGENGATRLAVDPPQALGLSLGEHQARHLVVFILDSPKQCGRWRGQPRLRRWRAFECINRHAVHRGKRRSSIQVSSESEELTIVLRLTGTLDAARKTFVRLLSFHCESPHNILKFASINDCASIGQHVRRLFDDIQEES
jgi:hypothetical protein